MLDTLGSAATIVAKLPTDCDQTKGLNAAQDILTAHPDVTAIYGACGPPVLGALQAIKSAGKSGITVVSFDASPGDVAAILAGNEAASVAQFPAKMGSLGAQTALDAAMGKAVRANVDTGTEMVTKDNASQFQ
jgi:simple sugar transport system substrate-binding protein